MHDLARFVGAGGDRLEARRGPFDDLDAVANDLGSTDGEQFRGRHPVA
jgi:hypothetical protein